MPRDTDPSKSSYREQDAPAPAVLVVGIHGNLVGIDRATGAILWKNGLEEGGYGTVYIALSQGRVFASAGGKRVFAVDMRTGATLWSAETSGYGRATMLVELDEIYVAKSGYLDCFDRYGNRRWTQKLEGLGTGPVALGVPGNVAQADDKGAK